MAETKAKTIIALPNDYTVIDLETTGLDYMWDEIIEAAAIRYRDGIEVARYEQLIRTENPLPAFITELTGITDDMLADGAEISQAVSALESFLGGDIIIGHNVTFDIRFLNHAFETHLGRSLTNPCVDTMRISRKLLPELQHHRLADLAAYYGESHDHAHRSGADCEITNVCYQKMRTEILAVESEAAFQSRFSCGSHARSADARNIHATTDSFDPDHPLYQKTVVFTGTLSCMTRADAMQLVVNCGGICGNGVNKSTNFLVIGTSDYISATEGKKTSKMLQVEKLQAKGLDIACISEKTFFDLLNQV